MAIALLPDYQFLLQIRSHKRHLHPLPLLWSPIYVETTLNCARTDSKLLCLSSKVRTFRLRRFLAAYIRFRRDIITIHTEADVVDKLRSFDAKEWKKAPLLRAAFKLAKQGKQKVGQSSRRIFPYCLRAFGRAQTCLIERMIVTNWWLKQAAKTTELEKLYEEPHVSATLRNNYDPSKPKAIGVFEGIWKVTRGSVSEIPSTNRLAIHGALNNA